MEMLLTPEEQNNLRSLARLANREFNEMIKDMVTSGLSIIDRKAAKLDLILKLGDEESRQVFLIPFKRSNDPGFSETDVTTTALVLELERQLVSLGRLASGDTHIRRFFPGMNL